MTYKVTPAYVKGLNRESNYLDVAEGLTEMLNSVEAEGWSLAGILPAFQDYVGDDEDGVDPLEDMGLRRWGPFFVLHKPGNA